MFKKLIILFTTLILVSCGAGSNSYTLGGTVTSASGISPTGLVLTDGTENVTITGSASTFTFPTSLSSSTAYTVSVKTNPVGVNCSVTNGTGTISASNVTSVTVNCVTGTESIIHAFTNTAIQGSSTIDGSNPNASLIMDSLGNFYGTTHNGGANSYGTIFEITANGTYVVLYSFAGGTSDGANPSAGLIIDSTGNLYGTTQNGGIGWTGAGTGHGIIFELAKTVNGYAQTDTVLYSFAGGTGDGASPRAELNMDSIGNLYGTTVNGGITGYGVVFELAKTSNGYATSDKILYSFAGGAVGDGANPYARLIMDSTGNIYGTTTFGGTAHNGTVFKLIPNGFGGYTESVIYSFLYNGTNNTIDGAYPYAGLIMDSAGNLYGTTRYGGGSANVGTIFKLTNNSGVYTETLLYSFKSNGNTSDGAYPPHSSVLIMDSFNNLYGTTYSGGNAGTGTVFKLTPNSFGGYTESIIYSFLYNGTTNNVDGANPKAGIIMDTAGNLYGTTFSGGSTSNYGTIFKIN